MVKTLYTFSRYLAAFVMFQYGFAKITGAQFTILDSELDKPLRDVSGFWLTWYYFGYSAVYGSFIALVQVVAGGLLLFKKTTLIAACVLLGVMSNIVLVDIFYSIDPSALAAALLVMGLLAFILWQHRLELLAVFWSSQNRVLPNRPVSWVGTLARSFLRVAMLVFTFASAYYFANFNNRLPTVLDGTWRLESRSGSPAVNVPSTIYFERNRAYMAVFKFADTSETHHFEVMTESRQLTVWETWLSKGPVVFDGRYTLSGDTLDLQGQYEGIPVDLRLERAP